MTIIMSYRTSSRSGLFETMILQQSTNFIPNDQIRITYMHSDVKGQCLFSMHSGGIWNDFELQRTF